jgi:hypothetical protein
MLIIQGALIFMTIVVFYCIFDSLRQLYYFNNFNKWNTVYGIITLSKTVKESSDSATISIPKIEYEYIIDGKRYLSKKIFLGGKNWNSFTTEKVIDICDKYSIGKKIQVFYNPKNQKISCLEKGTIYSIILGIVIEIFWMTLFIYCLLILNGIKIF